MYILKEINNNKKYKKSSVSANDTKRNCESANDTQPSVNDANTKRNCESANDTQPSVSDEHINELIKAALEKWMEEQKPKDTVQENIQKGFEKVDTVQKALDPTMAMRQHDKDTSEC